MKRAFSRRNLWERVPRSVKNGLGAILGVFPTEYFLGADFRHNFRFVEEAQWWPAERSQEYQLKELKRVCSLAYEKTAYYRKSFEEAGFHPRDLKELEDIRRLPLIYREILKDHLESMCAIPSWSPKVDYITTAGTSGAPLRFYIQSDRSGIEFAYLVSSWGRSGYLLGTPLAVLRGRIVTEERDGLRHEYDPILHHHYYSNFHMTEDNMRSYLEHIRGIGPCYLHMYPSSAAVLAQFIRRSGLEPPANILGILAESENVYTEQRSFVADMFGKGYFSSYGHTEKLVAAAECENSSDYHVWPTYGYFELLDEEGNNINTPGQRGEIVATGFINEVVPFIRYRTGDYATYVGDSCKACGRQHIVVEEIRGHRMQESLVADDGSLIAWTAVNMHDDTFDRVNRFQFYQEVSGKAILRIVPAKGFGEEDKQRLQRNLGQKFSGRLTFTIELLQSIPLSARGKAIYVDQHIPGAENSG